MSHRNPTYTPEIGDDLLPVERPMVGIFRAAPGHEEPRAAAIARLTAAVRKEPGCLEFRSFRDASSPAPSTCTRSTPTPTRFRAHLTISHVTHFFTELSRARLPPVVVENFIIDDIGGALDCHGVAAVLHHHFHHVAPQAFAQPGRSPKDAPTRRYRCVE